MIVCISSWWSGRTSKLCGLLVDQRRVDRAVDSGGFLSYACYCFCLFFVASVLSMLEMNILYAFLVSVSATCPAAESHPVLETSDGGTALVLRGTVRNCFCIECQVMVARLGCEAQSTALGYPDNWQCLCCWQVDNVASYTETPTSASVPHLTTAVPVMEFVDSSYRSAKLSWFTLPYFESSYVLQFMKSFTAFCIS
jgi:hypothetical protein